jgi:hypothetical protein
MDTNQRKTLADSAYVPFEDYQDLPRNDSAQDLKKFTGGKTKRVHVERRAKPYAQGSVQQVREPSPYRRLDAALLLVFEKEKPMSWEECRWRAKTDGDSILLSKTYMGVWFARRVNKNGEIVESHGKIMATSDNPATAVKRMAGLRQVFVKSNFAFLSLLDYYHSVHFDFNRVMRSKKNTRPKLTTDHLPPVHVEKPRLIPQASIHGSGTATRIPSEYEGTPNYNQTSLKPFPRISDESFMEKPKRVGLPRPMAWRKTYDTWLPQHYKASREDWWLESEKNI